MNNDPQPTQATSGTRPTRQIRVRRTYLIQRIQEWIVDIPAGYDTDEWLANDLGGFDDYVCDNGDLVFEDYDHVDYDELEVTVVTPTVAPTDRHGTDTADGIDMPAAVDEYGADQ